ncbi:hypothetical protein Q7P37_002357 [Cladosporium fusiforme]
MLCCSKCTASNTTLVCHDDILTKNGSNNNAPTRVLSTNSTRYPRKSRFYNTSTLDGVHTIRYRKTYRTCVAEMPASLQSLPVELRQRIYSLVLVESEPIHLKGKPIATPRAAQRLDYLRSLRPYSASKIRRVKARAAARSAHLRLLSTSKQTRAEAAPLFYGENKFSLCFERGMKAFERFLQLIGDMKVYLRHIILPSWCFMAFSAYSPRRIHRTMGRCLDTLVAATNLRSLEIPAEYLGYRGFELNEKRLLNIANQIKVVARQCAPLLKSLEASYRTQNLSLNVVDVIKIWGFRSHMSESEITYCKEDWLYERDHAFPVIRAMLKQELKTLLE